MRQTVLIELGPNEFTDKNDRIGLFQATYESHIFLSIVTEKADKQLIGIIEEEIANTVFEFQLADTIRTQERQAFNFVIMISEIGGLYGILIMIPQFLLNFYAERMYTKALAEEIPVK